MATCANAFTFAGVKGWKDEFGVAGTPSVAAVVAIVVAMIGIKMAVVRSDLVPRKGFEAPAVRLGPW